MEINYNPEMIILIILIKELNLIFLVDTMNMIGIIFFGRKNQESLFNKFKFIIDIVDNINNSFCEVSRPKQCYELIFTKKKPSICIKRDILYNIKKIYYSNIKYITPNTVQYVLYIFLIIIYLKKNYINKNSL